MNKILIATDIHGSAYWAQKVADKFHQHNCDNLVLLGDIYNHGPRNPLPQQYQPIQVADIFNALSDKLIVIQGNCDSQVDSMISQFMFQKDNILLCGSHRILLTHGHIYNKDNLPPLSKGDIVVYGHFHINEIVSTKQGIVCVNVGSASLPKDGRNAYAILDGKAITLYDFDDNLIDKYQL